MKEKIFSALKAKIVDKQGKTSISDKTFNAYVDVIAAQITDESQIETAIAPSVLALKETQANINAVAAQAVRDKEKTDADAANAKKAEEDAAKKAAEEAAKGGEKPDWQKAIEGLTATVQNLVGTVQGINAEKVANTRKSRLDETLKDSPDFFKSRISKDFDRLTFKDDSDYDEWLGTIQTDAETISKDASLKGAAFSTPKGGGSGKSDGKPSAEVQARIDARNAEKVASPIQGLPVTN